MRSFVVAKIAVFSTFILLTSLPLFGHSGSCDDDVAVLSQVLKEWRVEGQYLVVSPLSTIDDGWDYFFDDYDDYVAHMSGYIVARFATKGEHIERLVDRLFERNKIPSKHGLISSEEGGYVVDYDESYRNSLYQKQGRWELWYKEFPNARGFAYLSVPVYDEESGLLLIYMGRSSGYLDGFGHVVLYSCEDDTIKELERVALWMR